MKPSDRRILTTHTGSLPRPLDLVDLLNVKERASLRPGAFDARIESAIGEVVGGRSIPGSISSTTASMQGRLDGLRAGAARRA